MSFKSLCNVSVACLAFAAVGCGGDDDENPALPLGIGGMATGGASTSGGMGVLGGSPATGAVPGLGGTGGGLVPTGGALAETGGAGPIGGVATGGFATGGFATGGFATGGASTGGEATGGTSTGGVSTGGFATGGVDTGGAPTGGVSTGGEATGGVATGGVATGGTGTGGSGGTDCADDPPPNGDTCVHAVEWGWCGAVWMNGACAASCGLCQGSGGTGGTTGTGGVSTGGTTTGGVSTGGVATGGVGTGGVSTGGTSTGGGGGTVGKFVGNITTNNSIDTNGLTYSDYWDQITPENAGKWGSVQSTGTSAFNWATLDAIYDYTQQKGILFKQHTFVWGAQQPSGNITEAQVKTWIQTFCSRYPDTALIDVVNEPPPHTTPSYANAIGGGTDGNWQWITNAFLWADQYCPNAILILNDYNNIEWSSQTQHFIDITNTILAAGAPVDAVGAQAHGMSGGQVSSATMKSLLAKLHNDTGLPVYITEYDLSTQDDAAQLALYQDHISHFLDTEWVHGITIWGWIYGSTWSQAQYSGLIRNGAPRPAMTWLMDTLDRPQP